MTKGKHRQQGNPIKVGSEIGALGVVHTHYQRSPVVKATSPASRPSCGGRTADAQIATDCWSRGQQSAAICASAVLCDYVPGTWSYAPACLVPIRRLPYGRAGHMRGFRSVRTGVARWWLTILWSPTHFLQLQDTPLMEDDMLEQVASELFSGQLVALPTLQ
ncbi:MAG: hypothetical protein U0350_27240 [Caldilineaceae bacterium]